MLVLSREAGGQLIIGDNIILTITDIDPRGRVRIGIEAPRAVRIMRTELVTEAEFEAVKENIINQETESNARLIAAAPDLLKLLEQLVAQDSCGCGMSWCTRCDMVQRASEIVKRATGG